MKFSSRFPKVASSISFTIINRKDKQHVLCLTFFAWKKNDWMWTYGNKYMDNSKKVSCGVSSGWGSWSLYGCIHNLHITAQWQTHTPKTQAQINHLYICKNLQHAHTHTDVFSNSSLTLTHSPEHTLNTQLCSAPSSSWTGLKGYYFRPNYYLTSLSPADPAPPLFLWGTSLPEAHPNAPPCPPISQQHTSHFPSLL